MQRIRGLEHRNVVLLRIDSLPKPRALTKEAYSINFPRAYGPVFSAEVAYLGRERERRWTVVQRCFAKACVTVPVCSVSGTSGFLRFNETPGWKGNVCSFVFRFFFSGCP